MTTLPEARILRLQPGDVVVVTLEDRLTDAQHDLMLAGLQKAFPDNQVVIIERGDITVAGPVGEP